MTPADARRRSRTRGLWWALFTGLIVVEVLILNSSLPVDTQSALSYLVTYFTPMMMAILASFLLAMRFRGAERRFWGLLCLAVSAVFIPEVYWAYYEIAVDYRGPQIPNGWELGHLAGVLIFLGLVVSMTRFGEEPVFTRLRVYIDALGACVVAFSLVYWFWTLPLFGGLPMGGWQAAAVMAVYPLTGAVMLVTTAMLVWGWKAFRWRTWERLVSLSFAMYGIGLIAAPNNYASWIQLATPQHFDPYTIVLGFGMYLLFMAAVYRFTSEEGAIPAEPWALPSVRWRWLPVVFPSALSIALVLLGTAAFYLVDSYGGVVLVASTAFLAFVLIARSWLSSLELAHHRARSITDPVTGAFNQRHLNDLLPRELADTALTEGRLAVIAFDIVDFRDTQRMLGAEEGDRVLRALADLVRDEAPAGSMLYRVGTDEFVLAAPGLDRDEAVALAHRVNGQAGVSIVVDGAPLGMSAGVAIFPDHGDDAGSLVSRALSSQQLARSADRTDIVVFDAEVVGTADPLRRLEASRRRSHRAKLMALAAAVDARDEDVRHHSVAVNEIVSAFALVLDLGVEETRVLETAALVHDIGMLGVPDEVLFKDDALNAGQRATVEAHPELGEKLLTPADWPGIVPVVRHHHERWDGCGYPDGLAGADIPFGARVLSLCDAFEAMTSPRHYRPALSTAQALAEIERGSGRQFDPQLAEAFSRMVVRMHGRALSRRAAARADTLADVRDSARGHGHDAGPEPVAP